MADLIDRQAVQEMVDRIGGMYPYRQIGNRDSYSQYNEAWTDAINRVDAELNSLPSAQPEQLTDKEQRIFLAAMGREEKVCKQVDEECRDCREPYEDSLVGICHEITRKVKSALWET